LLIGTLRCSLIQPYQFISFGLLYLKLVYKLSVVIDNLIVLTIGNMKFKFYKFLLETSKRYQMSYKSFGNFSFLIVRIMSELIYFVFLKF